MDYTFRYFYDYGSCSTFQAPEGLQDPKPGEQHGFKLYFKFMPGDYQLLPGGWDIFIHDPDEWWAGNYN